VDAWGILYDKTSGLVVDIVLYVSVSLQYLNICMPFSKNEQCMYTLMYINVVQYTFA